MLDIWIDNYSSQLHVLEKRQYHCDKKEPHRAVADLIELILPKSEGWHHYIFNSLKK